MISLLTIHSAPKTSETITLFDFPTAVRGPYDPDYHYGTPIVCFLMKLSFKIDTVMVVRTNDGAWTGS